MIEKIIEISTVTLAAILSILWAFTGSEIVFKSAIILLLWMCYGDIQRINKKKQ